MTDSITTTYQKNQPAPACHVRHWVDRLRLRLSHWLFPQNGFSLVGNRTIARFSTPRLEATFTLKDREKPDGYSWDEMLGILDTFLGRKATSEEWNTILGWKLGSPAIAAATGEPVTGAAGAPMGATVKLTSVAAIRAACELSIAKGERHAEVMYKSDDFEDDDYVGADLDEFAEAVSDPDKLEDFCGGGRHSWELWVYEQEETDSAGVPA